MSCAAGVKVLDGVSLQVTRGSVTGLLGPSGCGKSTLMRAIVGVQIVAGGRVTVLDDLAGAPELRRRVGYVTQAPSVYRGSQRQREPALLRGGRRRRGGAHPRGHPDGGLRWTRASDRRGRFSGGQRSRVSLASALLNDPGAVRCWMSPPSAGPCAAGGAVEHLPRAGGGREHTADLQSCDGRGERVRRAAADARRGTARAGTPQRLREQTGEQDLGRAFLAIIERASS